MQLLLEQLPKEFKEFLETEGIDIGNFVETKSRYIRLKPNHNLTLTLLQQLISPDIQMIEWIPNMYEIPDTIKINPLEMYRNGQMYGIDLSSAAVVKALDIDENDFKVLEICCAPGAKLTYIADLMSQYEGQREIFGIDISANRLNITKSLLQKYKLDHMVKLMLADGTTYQMEKEFDKILVDAECTHEGSIKHLQKYTRKELPLNSKSKKQQKQSEKQLKLNHTNQYTSEQEKVNEWSKQDFIERFLDPLKLQNLTTLQYNLLENASTLIKQGGHIVYSTCSFSRKQNEEIVEKFLQQHNNFELIYPYSTALQIPCKAGSLENTVRFDPITSKCGGMFVAKLRKF